MYNETQMTQEILKVEIMESEKAAMSEKRCSYFLFNNYFSGGTIPLLNINFSETRSELKK